MRTLSTALVLGLSLGVGCNVPPVGEPLGPLPPTPGTCGTDSYPRSALDVLFVIDNSPGMATKQEAFAAALPGFVRTLEDRGIDYHIGVVTTDVGANPSSTGSFPGSRAIPGCASFSGDDGQLQALPCSSRSGLSAEAQAACARVCPDPRQLPTNGARYISRRGEILNVPSKKDPMGREIGAAEALKCMAFTGDAGCRIESPLESAKRALDGHLNENAGFLRFPSVLAVLFVTDEDDASWQISRRGELDPGTLDCAGNRNPDAPASCFNLELRSLARDLECFDDGGAFSPMTSTGPKQSCRERATSPLIPLKNYANFFNTIRPSTKLVLAGIVPPSLLGATDGAGLGKLVIEQDAAGAAGTPGLVPGAKGSASCYAPAQPVPPAEAPRGFIGQAQLRLSSFLRGFENHLESSICDTVGYASVLAATADTIRKMFEPVSCLGAAGWLELDKDSQPQCQVGYISVSDRSGQPASPLPRCGTACCQAFASVLRPVASDPAVVAACTPEPADCFCTHATAEPSVCGAGYVGSIWLRGGAPVPPETRPCFACLTRPSR